MVDAVADAPGRINLIGEHTDYHEGFVLPMIIPHRTRVLLTRRSDQRVRAASAARGHRAEEYELGREHAGRDWLDYVQGVTALLRRDGLPLTGFDLQVESDIPVGAGVSSSAALTVSLLRGLRSLVPFNLDDVRLAKVARAVETDFVGAPVGVMDHMVVSLGRAGEALFLDTRSLAFDRLPLPGSMEILSIDSAVTHRHAGGGYVIRRQESFEAAAQLGASYLRDLDVSDLKRINALPPILARRARHVITENHRVLEAVDALKCADVGRLGALFDASHASMRDDYEISTPDVDALVDIGRHHRAVHGARMTGGGFGGAAIFIADAGSGRAAAMEIRDEYARQRQRNGVVLLPQG